MAIRNEFLFRNAQATRFGKMDLAPSACTLASRLLPHSPLSSCDVEKSSLTISGAWRKIFFPLTLGNPTVKKQDDSLGYRGMRANVLLLMVIGLLFLSGGFVSAGPVGDFFKKVGQSISKPLQRDAQPEPPPQSQPVQQSRPPQTAKTSRATRRSTSRAASSAATTPPAEERPSHPTKEEEAAGSVRRVSAADFEKAKAGLPYGIPVPGRKGMVTSPYTPEDGKYIDVTDFGSGSVVKDPYTGKFFLVP